MKPRKTASNYASGSTTGLVGRWRLQSWSRSREARRRQKSNGTTTKTWTKAARALVPRTIFPGEWYLVREGNTRKGSGTFYHPSAARRPHHAPGSSRPGFTRATHRERRSRSWLSRFVYPACGSGSFLLAALRFLTSALVESLHHHQRLVPNPTGVIVRLADGQAATKLADETIPKPIGDPRLQRLPARLPPPAHRRTLPLRRRSRSACRRTGPPFPSGSKPWIPACPSDSWTTR